MRVGCRRGKVGEQLASVLREQGDVLLLAAQRHGPAALAGLQVEDPVSGFADGTGDEEVGLVEFE